MQAPASRAADFLAVGNARAVLHAAAVAACRGTGVLALVLEAEGSTYAREGTMALFDGERQAGWLSGGCLEPELAQRAAQAAIAGVVEFIEIDTRDDEDLLSGSALGCRGRLRIALLPQHALPGIAQTFEAWLEGGCTLVREVDADGRVRFDAGSDSFAARLAAAAPTWTSGCTSWRLPLLRPPEVLVLGAGPESAVLLRLLRELGWRTSLLERRPRWRQPAGATDVQLERVTGACVSGGGAYDAALVMHHNFELDREALVALAGLSVPFIGLLGPPRRRDDLFKLLSPTQRDALMPRLRAPIGLDLGGQGPEAIALSIAAQLQQWRAHPGADA